MKSTANIAGVCYAYCVHWDEMAVSVYLARGTLLLDVITARLLWLSAQPSPTHPCLGLYSGVWAYVVWPCHFFRGDKSQAETEIKENLKLN